MSTSAADKTYLETKEIKRGVRQLRFPYRELVGWLKQQCNVSVLNACCESYMVEARALRRLVIVYEFEQDWPVFHASDRSTSNYDRALQERVRRKFLELERSAAPEAKPSIVERTIHAIQAWLSPSKMKVVFRCFEVHDRVVCHNQVTNRELQDLAEKYAQFGVLTMMRHSGNVTVLFETDDQLEDKSLDVVRARITEDYYQLVKQHDEFDYIQREGFAISYESKEHMDQRPGGYSFR